MDDAPFFPAVKEDLVLPLTVILRNAKQNPSYLDHPECPYSPKLKTFLADLVTSAGAGSGVASSGSTFLDPNVDKFDAMFKELDRLYTDLQGFRNTLGSMEPNEKAQFFKTSMSLLEKIAAMQERIFNVKEMADFQKTVIGVMEELLDHDTNKQIIERLKAKV